MKNIPIKSLRKIAAIPARLRSSRLPGKGLKEVEGKPLLWYLVERLKACKNIDEVVLITTDRAEDERLVDFSKEVGVSVFRGSLEDVLGRFYFAAEEFNADIVVRANGDSPLLAPLYVDLGIEQLIHKGLEFITGKHRFTKLPVGAAPEFLTRNILEKLYHITGMPEDREHVTSYVFSHPESFSWSHLDIPTKYHVESSVDLTIDTFEDFCDFERIVRDLGHQTPANWTMGQIVESYRKIKGELNEG